MYRNKELIVQTNFGESGSRLEVHFQGEYRVTRLDSPNTRHMRSLIIHLEGVRVELEWNIIPLFELVFYPE